MKLILIILVALSGINCSSIKPVPTFPYKFYYLNQSSLIGPTEVDDRQLSDCVPNGIFHTCVVMFKTEFERMYQNYLEK